MTDLTLVRVQEMRRGSRRRPLPIMPHGMAAPSNPVRTANGTRMITADGTTIIRARKRA